MDTSSQSGGPAAPAPSAQVPAPAPAPHGSITHAGSVGEALSNLASYIPGFAGYKAVEDRRIADKQLRACIGEHLEKVKDRLDALVDSLSRAGSMESLAVIDQSGRRVEKLVDRMRFADYGYSAVFDRVHMGEPELTRIYQYDAGIMQQLGAFDTAVTQVEQVAGDPGRLRDALGGFDALTADFDRRFEARKHLFDGLPAP